MNFVTFSFIIELDDLMSSFTKKGLFGYKIQQAYEEVELKIGFRSVKSKEEGEKSITL